MTADSDYQSPIVSRTILQIIPTLGTGGAERACLDIANALCERGNRAIVVAHGGSRVEELRSSGGQFIDHPVHTKNPLRIMQNAYWLAQLIKSLRVDLVHARSRAPAWSAWLACRATNTPFVTTVHAAYKGNDFAPKRLYNSVMTRGDRVIAVSPFIARYISDNYGVTQPRLVTINRSVDLARFKIDNVSKAAQAAMLSAWNVAPETRIAFMPARLSRIKGQDLFIKAMAMLPPDVVGIIAGEDQGRKGWLAELSALITELNLTKRVRIVPQVKDMPTALSLASLVVAPSRVPEGFGRIPVEAMAMGVPVVASACGAMTDTISDGQTGFLTTPDNAPALANAMQRTLSLTTGQRQEMRLAGLAQAQNFSLDKMVNATLDVYAATL